MFYFQKKFEFEFFLSFRTRSSSKKEKRVSIGSINLLKPGPLLKSKSESTGFRIPAGNPHRHERSTKASSEQPDSAAPVAVELDEIRPVIVNSDRPPLALAEIENDYDIEDVDDDELGDVHEMVPMMKLRQEGSDGKSKKVDELC